MRLPSNTIRAIGVSQIDSSVYLVYDSKRRGKHKLAIASGAVGGKLVEQPGSPMLVGANDAPLNGEVRNIRYAHIDTSEYLTFSIKVGANRQWRIARKTEDWDMAVWEVQPTNLNVTQGLLVSDSSSSRGVLAVYIQNNLLHVTASATMRTWTDQSIVCNLPHRSYLVSAIEHALGLMVVYANQQRVGRSNIAKLHVVVLDRDTLQTIDHRTDVAEVPIDNHLHESIIGASIDDNDLYVHAVSKRSGQERYEIPLDLFHTPKTQHPYVPVRPELVEVLSEPEPVETSSDLKVLMFGWELPPHHKGGLGVATYGLTRALLDHGAQVTLVLPREKPVDDDSLALRFAGVEEIKLKYFHTGLHPYLTADQYEQLAKHGSAELGNDLHTEVARYAELAVKAAHNLEFDVIHTHDWLTLGAGVAVKRVTDKPLVAHIHSTSKDMAGNGAVDSRIWQAEHDGLMAADRIVAVSNFTKNILIELHGLDPHKIEVIHNGIDSRSYPTHQLGDTSASSLLNLNHGSYKTVLYVGRLTRHKGPEQFLNMAAHVLRLRPHTHFVFGGTGDQEHLLIRRAAELGISGNVHFAGWISGDDLTRLYRSADLYVLPSVSEPFGITPLEAIINGTPVLISKQSGVSEVLNSALKADFWDVDSMTQKAIAALDYPWLHKQLAQESLSEVRELTWQKAAHKTLAVYQQTLAGVVI